MAARETNKNYVEYFTSVETFGVGGCTQTNSLDGRCVSITLVRRKVRSAVSVRSGICAFTQSASLTDSQ